MDDRPAGATAPPDALRLQIESGLAREARERRARMWLTAAGALLGVSLLLNLLVLVAPGSVGLASGSDLDELRSSVVTPVAASSGETAAGATAERALVAARAAARRAARAEGAAAAVPSLCRGFGELGDWSFVAGAAPATDCPPGS